LSSLTWRGDSRRPRLEFRGSWFPHKEFVPNGRLGHVEINSAGFRGPEYPREAPEGIKRIAFIGDSETFGQYLKDDETLPAAVERELKSLSPAERYEALNFGVPGYNTEQELIQLRELAIHYNPDIVVLYYVLNDAGSKSTAPNPKIWWNSYLFVLYKTVTFGAVKKDVVRAKPVDSFSGWLPRAYLKSHRENFQPVERSIREIDKLLKARRVRFIIVIAPEIVAYADFKDFPYRDIHKQITAFQSNSVDVIDPLDVVAALGKSPQGLWVLPEKDPHKNAEATAAIAKVVARRIVGRPEPRPAWAEPEDNPGESPDRL